MASKRSGAAKKDLETVMDHAVDFVVAAISEQAGDPGPTGQWVYRGQASIEHLNTRKVGDDEARALAVDVKLLIETHASALRRFADATMLAALFLPGGAVRSEVLGPITFSNELQDYRIEAVGLAFGGVRLRKFSITPKDSYRLSIAFVASFEPSADEVARLAEYLDDEVSVLIEPETLGLPLEGESK